MTAHRSELQASVQRLDAALGPAPRAELLRVLMLPDFERADAIGAYWGTRTTQFPTGSV